MWQFFFLARQCISLFQLTLLWIHCNLDQNKLIFYYHSFILKCLLCLEAVVLSSMTRWLSIFVKINFFIYQIYLQFSLRIPDKGLNCRTQFLYSLQKRRQSEMSTHLKVNYNDQIPLVAGLHWKDMSAKASLQKWEGTGSL